METDDGEKPWSCAYLKILSRQQRLDVCHDFDLAKQTCSSSCCACEEDSSATFLQKDGSFQTIGSLEELEHEELEAICHEQVILGWSQMTSIGYSSQAIYTCPFSCGFCVHPADCADE